MTNLQGIKAFLEGTFTTINAYIQNKKTAQKVTNVMPLKLQKRRTN